MDETGAAAAIRLLRARHNAALAAHDLAGAMALTPADAVLVTGDGSLVRGAKAIREAWRGAFQRGDTYRRIPDDVRVGVGRAAEAGDWQGAASAGRYLAHWEDRPEGWCIVAETYVTLEAGAGDPPPGC